LITPYDIDRTTPPDATDTPSPAASDPTPETVPPPRKVPAVEAVQIPKYGAPPAAAGMLVNVCALFDVFDPADDAANVTDWRAYDPPVNSLAPVVPGVAVCRLRNMPAPVKIASSPVFADAAGSNAIEFSYRTE
jgi:hypothetical protein